MTARLPDVETPIARPLPDSQESKKLRKEINQRFANLKVPEVAPIESIRQRLQIHEVKPKQTEGTTGSSSGRNAAESSSRKSRYLALVKEKIDRRWVAPPVSVDQKNLRAVVNFRILRSGEVTNLRIEQGVRQHLL